MCKYYAVLPYDEHIHKLWHRESHAFQTALNYSNHGAIYAYGTYGEWLSLDKQLGKPMSMARYYDKLYIGYNKPREALRLGLKSYAVTDRDELDLPAYKDSEHTTGHDRWGGPMRKLSECHCLPTALDLQQEAEWHAGGRADMPVDEERFRRGEWHINDSCCRQKSKAKAKEL